MKRTDIFLYMTIINVAFGDPVIKKNCSELRKGERYHIATAEILGWSPDSCDQEWSLQNHTVMGYIEKNNTVLSPPMVSLTKQEAELESCVNFTVTLNCVQVVSLTFLVYPPETVEDESVLNPLGIAVAGCGTVLLLALLLIIVLRSCPRRSLSSPPSCLILEWPSCWAPDAHTS